MPEVKCMCGKPIKTEDMKCPKHPTYKALRKPTSGCEMCLGIYYLRWAL